MGCQTRNFPPQTQEGGRSWFGLDQSRPWRGTQHSSVFLPFYLCYSDPRSVVLLRWQLIRATENANSSKPTGNKPPNTLLCAALRKCSVHPSLSFPLREMGMMPGVGGISRGGYRDAGCINSKLVGCDEEAVRLLYRGRAGSDSAGYKTLSND